MYAARGSVLSGDAAVLICVHLHVLLCTQQLNIPSSDYMSLIYNLTEDWTRREGGGINEYKVRTTVDRDYVYSEQVLTEFGICYSSNNYLLKDVAASWQVLGKPAPPVRFDRFYDNKNMFSIVAGNQFDGDVVYTHKGYNVGWIMIHVHSPYEVMDVARKEFIVNQLISFSFLGTMIIADTDFREYGHVCGSHLLHFLIQNTYSGLRVSPQRNEHHAARMSLQHGIESGPFSRLHKRIVFAAVPIRFGVQIVRMYTALLSESCGETEARMRLQSTPHMRRKL